MLILAKPKCNRMILCTFYTYRAPIGLATLPALGLCFAPIGVCNVVEAPIACTVLTPTFRGHGICNAVALGIRDLGGANEAVSNEDVEVTLQREGRGFDDNW